MIHLDTSCLIVALVRGSCQDCKLREWLRAGDPLGMSSVAWAEFLCGPVAGRHVELAARFVTKRLAFEEEDAAFAARLFQSVRLPARIVGGLHDCRCGDTLRHEACLATNNPSDFGRFEAMGLTVIST